MTNKEYMSSKDTSNGDLLLHVYETSMRIFANYNVKNKRKYYVEYALLVLILYKKYFIREKKY